MHNLSSSELVSLYRTMKKIRLTEEAIEKHYREDNMHTPVHLYIGQEAVAAGVCFNLTKTDKVFSNHRNHGHYLAKGGNLNAMIAELYNKKTGCSGGYGGSMHLVDNEAGFPITSAIVAGGVPIATGNALASLMKMEKDVTVAFMGDAATEEGVVYESIAFSVLKKLPIIYICENNLYSVSTPLDKRQPHDFITNKFKGMLPCVSIDGNDVLEVQKTSAKAVDAARGGEGPTFIECKTYRLRDHHDTKTGVEAGYQTQEEWDNWISVCPIKKFEKSLREMSLLINEEAVNIGAEIRKELEAAFQFAANSELPEPDKLYAGVFA